MMRKIQAWVMLFAFVTVICAGLYLWWAFVLHWRPHPINKHQAEIAATLQGAGWVSPGLTGPKLYVIANRACADCTAYEQSEFPRLQKAGVDTRVIMVALPDLNGQPKSTPAERSTVAELWVNRSWPLFQRWMAAQPASWNAQGLAVADGDAARTAVIEAGRAATDKLAPLLKDNGIRFAYPTLIWWTKDGRMRGCACVKPQSYGAVRHELGAE